MILTFGAVFPPLAVSLAVTIMSLTYFTKLNWGRFIYNALEAKQQHYVDAVEVECSKVNTVSLLQSAKWMLITLSCWFYTLFLFDTLGDAVGFAGAYWVLIVVPLMPLCIYALLNFYCIHAAESLVVNQ
jgi:hypothetical protein